MQELQWKETKKYYEKWLDLSFLPPETDFVYRNGNNMTTVEPSSCVYTPCSFVSESQSQDVIVVGCTKTSQYLLAGAVTAFRSQTYFLLHREGRINGLRMYQPHIACDGTPEKVVILQGNDWRNLLKQYAALTAEAMGVPAMNTAKNLTGYCTWYYYYADVTEKDFLENVKILKEKTGSAYSPDVIQIDDGYQTFQGDWLDQDASWPTPLKKIASEIREAGITAGIWLMPFLASTASKTFRSHPDWFVKNAAGDPLIIAGWSPEPDNHWCCLDGTKPEVRQHITDVMHALQDMGFNYFKLDGLAYGLPDGVFSDPEATPVSAFRLIMKTIRDAVPDAFILGCGTPFMPCLGYIDMSRVSNDTSRCWLGWAPDPEHPQNSERMEVGISCAWHGTSANYWKADVWFRADPDVIMARSDNAFYTAGEARISAAAGILTGVCLTSDHLGRIAPDRMALLERAAKYRLRDARPENWKPGFWPCVFSGIVDGKKAALFVNDTAEPMVFRFAEYGLPDNCRELLADLGSVSGQITLPSHDAALVAAD